MVTVNKAADLVYLADQAVILPIFLSSAKTTPTKLFLTLIRPK